MVAGIVCMWFAIGQAHAGHGGSVTNGDNGFGRWVIHEHTNDSADCGHRIQTQPRRCLSKQSIFGEHKPVHTGAHRDSTAKLRRVLRSNAVFPISSVQAFISNSLAYLGPNLRVESVSNTRVDSTENQSASCTLHSRTLLRYDSRR